VRCQRGSGRRGVEAHAEEERSARRRCGGIRRGTKAAAEEWSARCQCGGGWCGVKADVEVEWKLAGAWWGNEL
jgi:hypothetical protein